MKIQLNGAGAVTYRQENMQYKIGNLSCTTILQCNKKGES